jgi:hypothetical protein
MSRLGADHHIRVIDQLERFALRLNLLIRYAAPAARISPQPTSMWAGSSDKALLCGSLFTQTNCPAKSHQ